MWSERPPCIVLNQSSVKLCLILHLVGSWTVHFLHFFYLLSYLPCRYLSWALHTERTFLDIKSAFTWRKAWRPSCRKPGHRTGSLLPTRQIEPPRRGLSQVHTSSSLRISRQKPTLQVSSFGDKKLLCWYLSCLASQSVGQCRRESAWKRRKCFKSSAFEKARKGHAIVDDLFSNGAGSSIVANHGGEGLWLQGAEVLFARYVFGFHWSVPEDLSKIMR